MMRKRIVLTAAMVFLFVAGFLRPVHAADFRSDYEVHYYPSAKVGDLTTHVSFKIKITNLKPDLYVNKFSLSFPRTFQIGNIKASDDSGPITPVIETVDNKQVMTMPITDPFIGVNTVNNIYLDFLQTNLFRSSGTTWEVMLPTIENREDGDYTIIVHVPPEAEKKISIAKPRPSHITLDQVTWTNPTSKTVYAIFGSSQMYSLQLRYHLQNPGITRVYTDVAFPPDTSYQKTYVSAIQPPPDKVFSDEDGNYMGRYILNPKESKTIVYAGDIQLFVQPRADVRQAFRDLFLTQRDHLLSADPNWTLATQVSAGKTARDIYDFTMHKLTYNFGRVVKDVKRLGASTALTVPDQAVCTEFSDVFIALARERGIFARELQGYGFSSDQDLRPLSLKSDILHSWPEYYDQASEQWIPTDPTWESTSGIDYFNSLDLNHVVFAIHGKKSDYPYPAGSYKIDDSKDVNIVPASDVPEESGSVRVTALPFAIPAGKPNTYTLKMTVQNTGNTYLWSYDIQPLAPGLSVQPSRMTIPVLAPYEKKEIALDYVPDKTFGQTKTTFRLLHLGQSVYTQELTIVPLYYALAKNVALVLLCLTGIYLCFIFIRKRLGGQHG